MKDTGIKAATDVLSKIETIEKEVRDLKLIVLKKLVPSEKKIISLKGVLKGVKITSKDIASAKKSLYGKVEI